MAHHGINFGAGDIPASFNKLFPRQIRRVWCNHDHRGNYPATGSGDRIGSYTCCLKCKELGLQKHGGVQFVAFRLQGVATTAEEMRFMVLTADNGHRKIHVVEKDGNFGIYTY